jgi:hypothetical protein
VSVQPTVSPSPSRTGPLTTGAGVLPGETPPVEPDLAKQHTALGAQVFARYFIKALSWSIATTDSYLIRKISAASCETCARYVAGLDSLQATGRHEVGGRLTVDTIGLATGPFKTKSDFAVQFELNETPAWVLPATSTPSSQPKRFQSIVFVTWIGGRFQVVEQGSP